LNLNGKLPPSFAVQIRSLSRRFPVTLVRMRVCLARVRVAARLSACQLGGGRAFLRTCQYGSRSCRPPPLRGLDRHRARCSVFSFFTSLYLLLVRVTPSLLFLLGGTHMSEMFDDSRFGLGCAFHTKCGKRMVLTQTVCYLIKLSWSAVLLPRHVRERLSRCFGRERRSRIGVDEYSQLETSFFSRENIFPKCARA
jgi:hypothetical protein